MTTTGSDLQFTSLRRHIKPWYICLPPGVCPGRTRNPPRDIEVMFSAAGEFFALPASSVLPRRPLCLLAAVLRSNALPTLWPVVKISILAVSYRKHRPTGSFLLPLRNRRRLRRPDGDQGGRDRYLDLPSLSKVARASRRALLLSIVCSLAQFQLQFHLFSQFEIKFEVVVHTHCVKLMGG